MSIGAVTFVKSIWLWGVALVPILYFISKWNQKRKKERFAQFADSPVWKKIAPELDWDLPQRKLRYWLLALLFFFLALARPQYGTIDEIVKSTGLDIMVALDVSRSMEVEDVAPNRLKKAQHWIRTFSERVSGDRLGLVAFAGSSQLSCPLTTDHEYLLEVVDGIAPESVASQGTDLGAALEMAVRGLDRGAEQLADPNVKNASSRVVLLISDGEDNEKQIEAGAKKLKEADVTLYVLGIGSEKGGPIPVRDALGQTIGFKRDRDGKTVLSQFRPDSLKSLADQAGGKFWQISLTEGEVDQIANELGALARGESAERKVSIKKERFQIPLLIDLLLLFLELSLPARKILTTASVLLILLGQPFPLAHASATPDVPTFKTYRENKKGVEAFQKEKISEAKKHFGNAQVETPFVPELQFNQGVLQMTEENWKGSAEAFRTSGENAEKSGRFDMAAKSYYNQGVVQTQLKDWTGAMNAYVAALRANQRSPDPELEAHARKNLELLIQKKQQDQSQSKDDQESDEQKDQKDKSDSKNQSGKNENSSDQQNDKKDQDQKNSDQEKNKPKTYQSNGKRQFKSEKLSPDDAKRVMSELSQREKALQKKLERMKGRPQGLEKDW